MAYIDGSITDGPDIKEREYYYVQIPPDELNNRPGYLYAALRTAFTKMSDA